MHARTIPQPLSASMFSGRSTGTKADMKAAGIRTWQPDRLLPGFEALELRFPNDYGGLVVAARLPLPAGGGGRPAVAPGPAGRVSGGARASLPERLRRRGRGHARPSTRGRGAARRRALRPRLRRLLLPAAHGGALRGGRLRLLCNRPAQVRPLAQASSASQFLQKRAAVLAQ